MSLILSSPVVLKRISYTLNVVFHKNSILALCTQRHRAHSAHTHTLNVDKYNDCLCTKVNLYKYMLSALQFTVLIEIVINIELKLLAKY